VTYKIITKLLVNRLKPILTQIISQEQSAFVGGRIISDNVLVAQEIFHSMGFHMEEGEMMAVKLDMERAYDLMGWFFIQKVLMKFGFHQKFIGLIMACIREPDFAVLVIGSPTELFRSMTGLWQGDPLSPCLFIIGAEVFVRTGSSSGRLTGVQIGTNGESVSQLAYADDCLLFLKSVNKEAVVIQDIVQDYCRVSGQKVNLAAEYKV